MLPGIESTKEDLVMKPEARLARPLKVLVPLIKQDIEAAREAGIEYYRAAGEKLLEAKSQVSWGGWGKWLQDNFALSKRTAQEYMSLAGEFEIRAIEDDARPAAHLQRREFRILSEFTSPNRDVSHRPQWHEPVRNSLTGNRRRGQ